MCISFIRRYVFRLSAGAIFATRDCLTFGSRAAVDQALSRLVKSGTLVRLARGVFSKYHPRSPSPGALEIATVKARAFGKQVAACAAELARELDIGAPRGLRADSAFSVNGRSSSFHAGQVRVVLIGTAPRKMFLNSTKAGRIIRALWHIGAAGCTKVDVMNATLFCGRSDRQDLRRLKAWMPGWMSALFDAGLTSHAGVSLTYDNV